MSISEFSKLRGMKLEAEAEIKKLNFRAENHIITIRDLTDPLIHFTDIEIERAEQAMTSLKVIINNAKAEQKKIAEIEQRIGK
ncbi:MAG: hypothetical protein RIC57_03530 [Balneola sp.]